MSVFKLGVRQMFSLLHKKRQKYLRNVNNWVCRNPFKNPFHWFHSVPLKSANTDLLQNPVSSKNSSSLQLEPSFNTRPPLQQHSMNTRSTIIIYQVIRESPRPSLTMSGFKLLCVIGPDRDAVDQALILKSTDTHLFERRTAIIKLLLSSKIMLIQYPEHY